MPQGSMSARKTEPVSVIGAGIAGTWQALMLAKAGRSVTLYDGRAAVPQTHDAGHWAGGMLAPHCEGETAEPVVVRLGLRSLALWKDALPDTPMNGSLVVAHGRDRAEYERFAQRTSGHRAVFAKELAELEPILDGRFGEALFYEEEGRVEPRRDLPRLHARLRDAGVTIHESKKEPADCDGIVIDCRGLSAREARDTDGTRAGAELRGVKGETVTIETHEIALTRAVRLLHPRHPIYVIPRSGGRYLVGATSIESEDTGVSVRSVLELLSAAYAVHPAFAEARIVEVGAGLRPAYPDNLPRIDVRGDHIRVNGLYRHGFLVAPALAELTVAYLQRGEIDADVMRFAQAPRPGGSPTCS